MESAHKLPVGDDPDHLSSSFSQLQSNSQWIVGATFRLQEGRIRYLNPKTEACQALQIAPHPVNPIQSLSVCYDKVEIIEHVGDARKFWIGRKKGGDSDG